MRFIEFDNLETGYNTPIDEKPFIVKHHKIRPDWILISLRLALVKIIWVKKANYETF